MEKYKGKILDVYYSSAKWSSIKINIDGKKYNASGSIDNPTVGINIEIEGNIYHDPKYGKKINVVKSKVLSNLSSKERGMLSLLSSGIIKGIGPSIAGNMISVYGENILEIIKNNPEKLTEIKGIGKVKAKKISKSYNESVDTNLIELYCLLNGEITSLQAKSIISKYGDNSIKIIKKNPYVLIKDLDGFGFLKTDKIAKSMNIPEDSEYRTEAVIIYLLKEKAMSEGNCYLHLDELSKKYLNLIVPFPFENIDNKQKIINEIEKLDIDKIKEKYNLSHEYIDIIKAWKEKRKVYFDLFLSTLKKTALIIDFNTDNKNYYEQILNTDKSIIIENKERVYEKNLLIKEVYVAKICAKFLISNPIKHFEDDFLNKKIKETEERKGFSLSKEQKEAGIKSLKSRISVITGGPGCGKTTALDLIIKIWNDSSHLLLLAPTGRASQRMTEATGYPAFTVQRKIMQNDKIENYLIIVDEMSMTDINLMYSLLKKYPNNQFVFVGDIDQLPSIGPGLILKNLIDVPSMPTSYLNECHRNGGSIKTNNRLIKKKVLFDNFKFDKHFEFQEKLRENTNDYIISKYLEYLKKYDIKDICVILPVKSERFKVNVTTINKILQDKLNPYEKNKCLKNFRLNDRVINTKNLYSKEVLINNHTEHGIFNGECGIVKNINKEEETLTVEFDDGKTSIYNLSELCYLDLAYAMTIHKAQGSEFKIVIFACNKEHYICLNNMIFYTVESRAKEVFSCIGETAAINMAIKTNKEIYRNVFLTERISFYKVNPNLI